MLFLTRKHGYMGPPSQGNQGRPEATSQEEIWERTESSVHRPLISQETRKSTETWGTLTLSTSVSEPNLKGRWLLKHLREGR